MWGRQDNLEDVGWAVPKVGYEDLPVCEIIAVATYEADAAIGLDERALEVAKEDPLSR